MKISGNSKGVVLVLVIILSIAMMIVTVGVVSTNYSKAIYSQHQIDRIKAEELAKGALWYHYTYRTLQGNPGPFVPPSETLDGKDFSVNVANSAGAGPSGTDEVGITISY